MATPAGAAVTARTGGRSTYHGPRPRALVGESVPGKPGNEAASAG